MSAAHRGLLTGALRARDHANTPRRIQSRVRPGAATQALREACALQPEAIAVLGEEIVRRATQRLPVEPVDWIRVPIGAASVAQESHCSGGCVIGAEIVAVQRAC